MRNPFAQFTTPPVSLTTNANSGPPEYFLQTPIISQGPRKSSSSASSNTRKPKFIKAPSRASLPQLLRRHTQRAVEFAGGVFPGNGSGQLHYCIIIEEPG